MRIAVALAIAFTAVAPSAVAFAEPVAPPPHHRHHHHHAAPAAVVRPNPAPETVAPAPESSGFKPYPFGRGDEDGLSRDPDDCNKGCIGGNPG